MAVKIIQATTASFGTSGSAFGSMINLNVSPALAKTLNPANYPLLTGQVPTNAWLSIPAGAALEFTNDGGTTWTQAIAGPGSGVWYVDGFTSRVQGGAGTGVNVTFIPFRQSS